MFLSCFTFDTELSPAEVIALLFPVGQADRGLRFWPILLTGVVAQQSSYVCVGKLMNGPVHHLRPHSFTSTDSQQGTFQVRRPLARENRGHAIGFTSALRVAKLTVGFPVNPGPIGA